MALATQFKQECSVTDARVKYMLDSPKTQFTTNLIRLVKLLKGSKLGLRFGIFRKPIYIHYPSTVNILDSILLCH
jgi:hypothetical protein